MNYITRHTYRIPMWKAGEAEKFIIAHREAGNFVEVKFKWLRLSILITVTIYDKPNRH